MDRIPIEEWERRAALARQVDDDDPSLGSEIEDRPTTPQITEPYPGWLERRYGNGVPQRPDPLWPDFLAALAAILVGGVAGWGIVSLLEVFVGMFG